MTQRRVPASTPADIDDDSFGIRVGDVPQTGGWYHEIRNKALGGNLSGIYALATGFPFQISNTYSANTYKSNTVPGSVSTKQGPIQGQGHHNRQGPAIFLSGPTQTTTVKYEVTWNIYNKYLDYNGSPFKKTGTATVTPNESLTVSAEPRVAWEMHNWFDTNAEVQKQVLPRYNMSQYQRAYFNASASFSFVSASASARFYKHKVEDTIVSF